MSSVQHDKRVIVYPAYLDSGKTVAEGRRIPKPNACSEPNVLEIFDAAKILGLKAEIQDKTYPRDFFTRGRVRVEFKLFDGTLLNPHIPDRRTMMIRIAEIVPKHPGRSKRAQAAAAEKAKVAELASSSGTTEGSGAGGGSSKGGGGSSKKKNKNKK